MSPSDEDRDDPLPDGATDQNAVGGGLTQSPAADAPYAVLARKYRPQDFDALIGQDMLVRVLSNAFQQDRIPHALMLTGVRGVGKTTTARIIAKGLNCLSSEGPTIKPCGTCANCVAIAESRHSDVLEMDAASRTGIDDIREIIESVRYRASQGRYKVYIIDEVHMLSKNAFNGLLKTLEEPPAHVKFVLATTDIHKVPVTVLSRCMRFDLQRVSAERLIDHLRGVCQAEGATAEDPALAIIARVAEGSVRDALSLLDQAISHGAGAATEAAVRDMLGLAERGRLFALFEQIMAGDAAAALDSLRALYTDGGDPVSLLREVAEICHLVTVTKVSAVRLEDPTLPQAEREATKTLAERLPMRALSRAWQLLLKGIEETSRAPTPLSAAEMVLIRMAHVAELPPPEELIRRFGDTLKAGQAPQGGGAPARPNGGGPSQPQSGSSQGGAPQESTQPESAQPGGGDPGGRPSMQAPPDRAPLRLAASAGAATAPIAAAQPSPAVQPAPPQRAPAAATEPSPEDFEGLIALIRKKREAKLLVDVESYVRPGPLGPARFEFTPKDGAPPDLAAKLGQRLSLWTGERWLVSVASGHDAPTLAEARRAAEDDLRAKAAAHPLVQAALAAFPGAALQKVTDLSAAAAIGGDAHGAATGALEDPDALIDDEEDPFEFDLSAYSDDDFNRDPL